ncbi:NCS2 family permease [Desulfovermiculus halophilus]|jgi:AGZA family xanthine/uracil permease-like MFS transporter|uniref:NCS2 family permease n=1 Tax=Desulfovermiculus halophilus TaxID=339722 RepID=UPI000489A24A|nr:NCS2 family permease [Desulfovermiculus halophilus]
MLDSFFQLTKNRTTVRQEVIAGVTTFLTMSYVIFVNPSILADAGMDKGAVFVATCFAAVIGTLIMGVVANYPVALAPGMGLTAFFTYTVVLGMGVAWQTALGAVFISGVVFLVLSILPVREWLINSIPRTLKVAIAGGIGFFLAIIGLKNTGIIVAHPSTLVSAGSLTEPTVVLSVLAFALMAALHFRRIPGAILISILAATGAGVMLQLTPVPGFVSRPPSLAPTLLQMDVPGALEMGLLAVIFTFVLTDLFDSAGTLVGVTQGAGMVDKQGRLPRLKNALFADSSATIAGSVLGTSTTTSYVESLAGVEAGGRTGLTAVTVAVLFLLSLFFAPLAGAIPSYATAPALVFVACLMAKNLKDINWDDLTEYIPAVITMLAMPLTFSIATGIGFGFISYALIKTLSFRLRDLSPSVLTVSGLFLIKFIVG